MNQSKILKLVCIGFASLAFASCSEQKDTEPDYGPSDLVHQLAFKSDLRGMSRATETAFETGDEISLFAVAPGEDETLVYLADADNYIHNAKFTYDGSQFKSEPPVYKKDADKYAYFAVYPYVDNAGPEFTFNVKEDQSDDANYTASDLCTATTSYTTESVPTLTFSHRLANIVVDLEGNNLGGDVKVELASVLTSAEANLNNVTFHAGTERGNVVCNENGTNSWRAIIAPQTIAQDEEFLKVSMNGRVYNLKAPATLNLESGRKVNVTLRVVNEEIIVVTGDIYPWDVEMSIEYIIPDDILDKMEDYIDIYPGVNPPNIEGCFFIDPFLAVYCEDENDGGYPPGYVVSSQYVLFKDQDMQNNTINYSELAANLNSYSIGNGAFISGEGDNFTVFFDTEGSTRDIYTRQALVISGTKTWEGISNLKYAFVMVEKGDDPEEILMEEGIFRVFEDGDYISTPAVWPESSFPSRVRAKSPFGNFEKIMRKK